MRHRPEETDNQSAEDDAAVIARSLADPERFALVFDRHAAAIHRYLTRRLGGDAADDLVGETFLTAFRRRASFDTGHRNALPWLYGIATRLVAQHRRDTARAARRPTPAADAWCHADQVAADVTATALHDTLIAGLADLNEGDRDVLLLIAQEELTYEQVAAALEIPVGTVRSRLNRARTALRAALGGTNPLHITEEVTHG
jgi:RNA polymerase sigma-70 factor (ECF subfamily)